MITLSGVAVPLDSAGDGQVFDPMAKGCVPPEVVRQDPASIRDQYLPSVACPAECLMDWALLPGTGGPLVLIPAGDAPVGPVAAFRDCPRAAAGGGQ